jgi:coronin-7
MDKVSVLAYHPTAKHVLATASQDIDKPTLRIWSTTTTSSSATSTYTDTHKDTILAMAWRPDGKAIATVSKDKQLRIVDARTGHLIGQATSHQGIRPSRLVWLDDDRFLVSVGFGLGSMREILLYDTTSSGFSPLAKKSIDVSPSIMNVHFDRDCNILYVAGKVKKNISWMGMERMILNLFYFLYRVIGPFILLNLKMIP